MISEVRHAMVTPQIEGFEIIREIGRGGMGTVYTARQVALDRLVAVKVLSIKDATHREESLVRFRREAELMAKVHHPNILMVFDFGTVDGQPYLVTEHVDSGDLRQYMKPGYPMPNAQARTILRSIGTALDCLHQHGILHRDLKPENILMRGEGYPVVGDFGIAVFRGFANLLTKSGQSLGTLGYIAPEQQYRLAVDERADQYSLAALAYELLTGQLPLGIFPLPSRLNPQLNPEVDDVLRRALQDDPADRYPKVREFVDELDRSLSTGRSPRISPWVSRILTVIVLSGLMVLIGAASFWFASRFVPTLEFPSTDRPKARVSDAFETGDVFQNSCGMNLVLIRRGHFEMGSPESDTDADPTEKPQVPVEIDHDFLIGQKEVKVGLFRVFVEETGYVTLAEQLGGQVWDEEEGERFVLGVDWRNPGLSSQLTDDHPVVQVCLADAEAFCDWLSEREGIHYRLLTEQELEYATRAGTNSRWSFGDDPSQADDYACCYKEGIQGPDPVGSKAPNGWGLYDLHGNVQEWCSNVFRPLPNQDPANPKAGRNKVVRGGCWRWGITDARSASRFDVHPTHRSATIGFRICQPNPEVAGKALTKMARGRDASSD